MQTTRSRRGIAAAALTAAFAIACAGALPPDPSLPKTTHDGLVLQDHTELRAVYLAPGADFAPYHRVKLLDCYVAFDPHWVRDYNDRALDYRERITPKQLDAIKQRVATDFRRIFTHVLEKHGIAVVDETGEDVLLVRPAVIDLTVTAPYTMQPEIEVTFVSSAGSMTLYAELYDSATNAILARLIDPESDWYDPQVATSVTNEAEEERAIGHWAEILAHHIGQTTGWNDPPPAVKTGSKKPASDQKAR